MRYEIRYLPLAQKDIDQIIGYLSQFYPQTAGRMFRSLETKIDRLSWMPKMYEVYSPNPFYRKMVVGKYLVFYHVDEQRGCVEIYRVLRGAWDITKYLPEDV